ncbi:MAG TPA: hypothetical protein VFX12_11175 [Vicinamibacterales bacterium]|nr:hypothetical protein [Vicinamibacterales bacterium]
MAHVGPDVRSYVNLFMRAMDAFGFGAHSRAQVYDAHVNSRLFRDHPRHPYGDPT